MITIKKQIKSDTIKFKHPIYNERVFSDFEECTLPSAMQGSQVIRLVVDDNTAANAEDRKIKPSMSSSPAIEVLKVMGFHDISEDDIERVFVHEDSIEEEVCDNYFDHATSSIYYPEPSIIVKGLPSNTTFDYISKDYIAGMINYINAFYAIEYKYCLSDHAFELEKLRIDTINMMQNTDMSNIADDVIVVGSIDNDWYILYIDNDPEECKATRLTKTPQFKTESDIINLVKETAARLSKLRDPKDLPFYEIKLHGRITL